MRTELYQLPNRRQCSRLFGFEDLSKTAFLATILFVEPYSTPTRMPRLPDQTIWINRPHPGDAPGFENQVLLFDVWDYTCVNCLRTLPYLREWYARYQQLDFTLIGVHTPEFPFAGELENVRRAVQRLGIRWPVVLDNDQSIWTAFANRYWPTKYLADRKGYLRYRHAGEGQYQAFEVALQELLRESDGQVELPEIMNPVREEDHPAVVCLPTTPELQADSLGNPVADDHHGSRFTYTLPGRYEQGKFYLQGSWESIPHGHRLVSEQGRIVLSYEAARCNAVLSGNYDASNPEFHLDGINVNLNLDGAPLPPEGYAQDVLQLEGQSVVRVDTPRMYSLVEHGAVEAHLLSLEILEPGLAFYAFSFESCASNQKSPQSSVED